MMAQEVFAERAARRPGFLQSLDARAKLLSLVALLVAASFLHHLPSLWLLAAAVAAAAGLSRLGVRTLLNRVWWFLPAAFALIAIPAAFSFVTPGDPLVVLCRGAGSAQIAITRQGLATAALLVTRVFVGVLLAVTLTLTTCWQDLLKAAYTTATAPFVFTLAMTYRYLFVLLRTFQQMHLARRARTISPGSLAEQHRWIGGRIAALFSRSRRLSEEVYAAMLARGYRGRPRSLAGSRCTPMELAWLGGCAAAISLCLLVDRAVLRGLSW
jgi:cobalt ECF transporter T component CbiQ